MERAGEILRGILEDTQLEEGSRYVSFFRSWDSIAGSPLSDHTRVVDIQRETILVEIDHPGWFQMFRLNERKILRRIKKSYPELRIRGLRARVVPRDEGDARTPVVSRHKQDSKRTGNSQGKPIEGIELLPGIDDQRLRGALERLAEGLKSGETGEGAVDSPI